MKKILAIAVALLLAAAPALAQRDETIYATLSPTGEVLSVEAGVRVEGEAGEYTETGDYASVEALSGQVSYADGVVTCQIEDGQAVYFDGLLEGAVLPWTVSVTTSAEIGASGPVDIDIHIAPNPDCADAYYAENLALQMTLSVDLDSARIVDCAGATQTVTGSTATLAWIGLPGGEMNAHLSLETESFVLGDIQIAAMPMNLGDMLGDFDISQLTDGGAQLTEGMQALSDGLSSFEITPQQQAMIASLATMETDDPDAQLMQALLNQFLPMLDSLDTLKEGVAQLNDGLNQYVGGINGAMESLLRETEAPRSFAGAESTDSIQFVLRVPAQSLPVEAEEPAAEEEEQTVWERITGLFGG